MLVSISKRRKRKQKSPEAQNRSIFLKAFFGMVSGDRGNGLMASFNNGNYKKFIADWEKISSSMVEKSIEKAKELGKYEDEDTSKPE